MQDKLRKNPFKINIIIGLILIFLTNSCYRDPMDINFNNIGNNIVIEGNLNNQDGAKVLISKTIEFNSTGEFPRVENAQVVIEDQNNQIHELTEIQPGVYRNYSFRGIPNNTYELTVVIDYEIYNASSTMPQPLTLQNF